MTYIINGTGMLHHLFPNLWAALVALFLAIHSTVGHSDRVTDPVHRVYGDRRHRVHGGRGEVFGQGALSTLKQTVLSRVDTGHLVTLLSQASVTGNRVEHHHHKARVVPSPTISGYCAGCAAVKVPCGAAFVIRTGALLCARSILRL